MLVSVLSVKGSPGVTTFAVALAARWPEPARAVVVEVDPAGGDLGMRFSLPATTGLVSLAAAARHSAPAASTQPAGGPGGGDLLWSHVQELPGGLPVVAAPPDADQAKAALLALMPAAVGGTGIGRGVLRLAADDPDTVVVVDCGRADPGSPAVAIARDSDVAIIVSRAHADDLAHLPRRLETIGAWTPNPMLLLAGPGYSVAAVARALDARPFGRIPDDPVGAAAVCGRPSKWRFRYSGPSRSPLGRFAHTVAVTLADRARPAAGEVAILRSVPGMPSVVIPRPARDQTRAEQ